MTEPSTPGSPLDSPITDVALLLANSAEQSSTGLVSALGLGWSSTTSPTSPAALVMFVKVPWDLTNVRLTLALTLVSADGVPVAGDQGPLRIVFEIEVGRPAGVAPGTPIDWSQAVNLAPIALDVGRYEWRLEVDGVPTASRPFAVRPS